jgi:hypothetical protein
MKPTDEIRSANTVAICFWLGGFGMLLTRWLFSDWSLPFVLFVWTLMNMGGPAVAINRARRDQAANAGARQP